MKRDEYRKLFHIRSRRARPKIVQKMAGKNGLNVQYPSVDPGSHGTPYKKNETASHQWFKENKRMVISVDEKSEGGQRCKKNLESEKDVYLYRNKN